MKERDIEFAAEAGAYWEHGDWNLASSVHFSEEELHKFAELIRADEREACALIVEDMNSLMSPEIAKAIRARGEQ